MNPEKLEQLYISLWFMEARADGPLAIGALVAIILFLLVWMLVVRPKRGTGA